REMRERMVLPFSLQLEECFSIFIKNSLIHCYFSLRCEIAFSAIQKLKLFSLLKIKEGLKTATEIALLFLMASFFFQKLAYRTAIFRFATKSRFQQLPNLTIRSLLKIKEGLKQATKIALRVASPPCYRVFACSQGWQTKTLVACF
ncbi:MAG: hypothetical protein K2M99_05680, partial [Treponemataceae bacterium]|nr:hypothetical protein [Treponemataceae bacterium]